MCCRRAARVSPFADFPHRAARALPNRDGFAPPSRVVAAPTLARMPGDPRTPADLLAAALRADPARAFVTFHDDATGERAELSVATFANWVAKAANLARDELGLQVGDRVGIALPPHWQAMVWWQACWSAGLVVVPVLPAAPGAASGPPGVPLSALVRPVTWDDDALPAPAADEVVALGLGPMGLPVPGATPPPGALDHDREIHGYGDRFDPPPGLSPDAPALAAPRGDRTAGELADAARAAAARWALGPADRVLVAVPLTDEAAAVATLLAPLVSGAAVVLLRHSERADDETLARRVESEGVTALVTGGAGPGGTALTSRLRRAGLRHLD